MQMIKCRITSQLFPVSLLMWFLTQPEVKFHIFKRLKRSEGKLATGKIFLLFISEPRVECNKKIKKFCHRHFKTGVSVEAGNQQISPPISQIIAAYFLILNFIQVP